MFESEINPGEIVIGDDNFQQFVVDPIIDGEQKTRGRVPRNYLLEPFGATPVATPWPDELTLDEQEIRERAEELEKTKSRISDLSDRVGLPCLDQNGTNYCWCNGPTYCVEVVRAIEGLPVVLLSPASVGGPVTSYRNVGGWGTRALQQLIEVGAVPVSNWPANAIQRSYDTPANRALAAQFKVLEWWELKPRAFLQLCSALVLRVPVAIGLNWWSHEVTACDVVVQGGDLAVRIRNSWGMSWGDRGYSILTRSKATPDDAVAPRVVRALTGGEG